MNSSQIAGWLRAIADAIESNPEFAKAVEKHLVKSSVSDKAQRKNEQESNSADLLSESRKILREQGEDALRAYLVELGEQIREVLKHGQLDPTRSIRRRKDLNSIIEHIIQKLKEQDKSGTVIASAISEK